MLFKQNKNNLIIQQKSEKVMGHGVKKLIIQTHPLKPTGTAGLLCLWQTSKNMCIYIYNTYTYTVIKL